MGKFSRRQIGDIFSQKTGFDISRKWPYQYQRTSIFGFKLKASTHLDGQKKGSVRTDRLGPFCPSTAV